jgi:glycosyltransferase involved in cell wall biosynthesis
MTSHSQYPSVTTVIAAFNAERFLGEAIESALAQDYERHEVVVVDDGSTDRTAEIARGYDGVRVISQENQGPGGARNTGIAAAGGELIAILDSDDLMVEGRLQKQVRYLLDHRKAGAVLGLLEPLVEPGVEVPPWIGPDVYKSPRAPEDENLPFGGVYVAASMVAWRRTFEAIGGYDPAFHHSEDLDWLLRLMESDLTVGTIDEVVVIRRVHGGNMVYDQAAQKRYLFKAFKARIDRRRADSAANPQ